EHPAGEVTRLDWQLKNQVPRNPPFTAVRITEGEMKSYHDFIGGCIRLECMAKKGICIGLSSPLPTGIQAALLQMNGTECCLQIKKSPENSNENREGTV
uniref:Uncharacterized protein n=1 Tax=Coturnix japonica TaxID=93934 RepID=A0A8C2TQ37_COTJA